MGQPYICLTGAFTGFMNMKNIKGPAGFMKGKAEWAIDPTLLRYTNLILSLE
jgi:hypothetical protein